MLEEVYFEVHFTLCVSPGRLAEVLARCRKLEPGLSKVKVKGGAKNKDNKFWAGGDYGSDIELTLIDGVCPDITLFEVNGLIANYTSSEKAKDFLSFLCTHGADARIWMEENGQKTVIVLVEGLRVA